MNPEQKERMYAAATTVSLPTFPHTNKFTAESFAFFFCLAHTPSDIPSSLPAFFASCRRWSTASSSSTSACQAPPPHPCIPPTPSYEIHTQRGQQTQKNTQNLNLSLTHLASSSFSSLVAKQDGGGLLREVHRQKVQGRRPERGREQAGFGTLHQLMTPSMVHVTNLTPPGSGFNPAGRLVKSTA
jgi:hypothetical protein